MLEKKIFLEILKKHGAEITGEPVVTIAGEDKTAEELVKLLSRPLCEDNIIRITAD